MYSAYNYNIYIYNFLIITKIEKEDSKISSLSALINEHQFKRMTTYKGGVIRGLLSQLDAKFQFEHIGSSTSARIILTGKKESCQQALYAIND